VESKRLAGAKMGFGDAGISIAILWMQRIASAIGFIAAALGRSYRAISSTS
jgi:hypothetical protein